MKLRGRKNGFDILAVTGLNAALGIDDIPDKLEYSVKGYRNPVEYFSLLRNSLLIKKYSHTWIKDKVVTMLDDHLQVRKGENKAIFCVDHNTAEVIFNALALNAMTLGIPCIYYGS